MKSKKMKKLLVVGMAATIAMSNVSINTYGAETTSVTFPLVSFEDGELYKNYTGGNEGEANYVKTEIIDSLGATNGSKALKATYYKGNWPGVHFYPTEGQTWDFANKFLCFDVTNTSNRAIQLCIKFDGETSSDVGQDATYVSTIAAGKTMTINTVTGGGSVNLGMLENPPSSAGVTAAWGWGNKTMDYSSIKHITFWINSNPEDCELIFDNLHLIDNPNSNYEEAYKDLADEYGQYTKNTNSNKITKDSDFAIKKAEEDALLQEQLKVTNARNISKYYGLKDESLKQKATGHYYATKINEKWMLVDPEGYPYYSTGVDIIRTADALSWTSKREFMFTSLPSQSGSLGDHYSTVANCAKSPFDQVSGLAFNFYTANLERKYGNNWETEWKTNALNRFKAWGFSSLGCWAEPDMFYGKGSQNQFPYVAHAWINANHTKISNGSISISDPFDPAFKAYADAQMKDLKARGVNEDPYCTGIYVDNEIQWGNGEVDAQKYVVVDAVFGSDASSSYSKKACIDLLKEKYSTIANLNKAWNTNLASWDALNAPYTGAMATSDKSACLSLIGDKYYKTVSESVKTYLPNIIYLGSRLAHWGCGTEIIQACAKYADVVSFNCYRKDINQSFMQLGTFDKPIIIGEFHFNATDNNNFTSGLVPVGTQKGRGEAYTNFMTSAYENKYFVGAHWFQYYDQPTLGRAWDGENSNCGFVDVTDQPYKELVSAAKEINEKAYEIRLSNVSVQSVTLDKTKMELTKDNSTGKLIATVLPENATNKNVTFTSSDSKVVTVDENGNVKALKNGTATITVVASADASKKASCVVNVTGFATAKVTFPSISFESGEIEYFKPVANKDMTLEKITNEGVTDGKNALKVTINDLEKDPNKWNLGRIDMNYSGDEDGWNLGDEGILAFDVVNTNNSNMQLRVNVTDADGGLRTYYYNFKANEKRYLEVKDFGVSADNWGAPDGFYTDSSTTAGKNGIDTSKITCVSIYMWENSDEWVKDTEMTKASFIIDNITTTPRKAPVEDDKDKENTPAIVTGVSVSNKTMTSISIKWSKDSKATAYEIYRATSKNGTYSKIATVSKDVLSYTNTKLITGKTYYYKVKATNGEYVGEISNYTYATATPYQTKSAYVHNYGRNAFKIGWAKQSGVSGYRVYKSTSRNGKYERIATVRGDSNITFVDKNVKSGKTYYYKVRAYKTVSGKMIFGEYSGIKYRKR